MTEQAFSPLALPFALDGEELHRQWELVEVLSQALGNPLEIAQMEGSDPQTVLDVGCGVGGWSLELARLAPAARVIGLDARPACVAFARRMARQRGLSNARFLAQDLQTVQAAAGSFTPGSLDLIHLAFMAPSLLTTSYPALLAALFPLARPGGLLLWTETELPITTSPACERFTSLICQALDSAGQSFVPSLFRELAELRQERTGHPPVERRHVGITMMMGSWLRECGFQQVECHAHAVEVSAGTRAHPTYVRQIEVALRQIRPWLLAQGLLDEQAYTGLSSQVLAQVQQEDFCGLCYLLTVRGQTPC